MTTHKPTKTTVLLRWPLIAVAMAAVATVSTMTAADPDNKPRETEMKTASMPAQPTNLFLLEDLEDVSKTKRLADSDLKALRVVAD